MYINYTEASFFWKDTVLNSGKRQHFVEMWSKIDFLYTWLLRMSLSHQTYIFKLYVVTYQKLHSSSLRLHLHGHKHPSWGTVSILQPKQHNAGHFDLHTPHPVLSIHPMILGTSSFVHFLSTTHALCAPFAWSYHRNKYPRHSSYLCVSLCNDICTHQSWYFYIHCIFSLYSFQRLSDIFSPQFVGLVFSCRWDHKNCSTDSRFSSRLRTCPFRYMVCGRPAHLSYHHSISDGDG